MTPLLVPSRARGGRATAPGCLPEGRLDLETVVLVHGQGRTRASLVVLAQRLRRAGYATLLYGYSVRSSGLDEIARGLLRAVEQDVATPVYHLVGHSLGNVIARHGFRWGYPPGLRRMVMLAPPNGPADLALRWRERPLFRRLTGEAGQRLADRTFYATLPVPPVPFGVIAGDLDHTGLLREPSDGVVSVVGTRLPGMAGWIVLHHTHTFLMHAADTGRQVSAFLRNGKFACAGLAPGQAAGAVPTPSAPAHPEQRA